LPLLVMVSVVVVLVCLIRLPNAIVPDSPMMRVTAMPVPESVVVLVPLVASLVTVSVLL